MKLFQLFSHRSRTSRLLKDVIPLIVRNIYVSSLLFIFPSYLFIYIFLRVAVAAFSPEYLFPFISQRPPKATRTYPALQKDSNVPAPMAGSPAGAEAASSAERPGRGMGRGLICRPGDPSPSPPTLQRTVKMRLIQKTRHRHMREGFILRVTG